MVKFIENLSWRTHAQDFKEGEQKILLALSNEDYLWRSFDRLTAVTRLDKKVLAESLDGLMTKGVVRPSISSESKEPIYGLVERVGPGNRAAQQMRM